MPTDPWQKAHDDLERVLLLDDSRALEAAVQLFEVTILKLLASYKCITDTQDLPPAARVQIADIMMRSFNDSYAKKVIESD